MGGELVAANCELDVVTCIICIKFKVKGSQTELPAKIIWESEKKIKYPGPMCGKFQLSMSRERFDN